MIIKPLGRRAKPKDFALLTPGQRELGVETLSGHSVYRGRRAVEGALEKLKPFACFVSVGLERLKYTTGATSWTLQTWHGRETKMTHDASGTSVTSLRGTLESSTDPFGDLARAMAWFAEYDVSPGGLSAMSWSLFRASLHDELRLGFDPEISDAAFFGGRQAGTPGRYYLHKSIDKVAAYPTAMASLPVAAGLHEVSPATLLDPTVAGLARARVIVPQDITHPPLPVRIGTEAIQFQWGVLEGVWTWVELDHAASLGCEVNVTQAWAPSREIDLFGSWWQLGQTGRSLPGNAAALAKATVNCLWGQLAMSGTDQGWVRWADDAGAIAYVEQGPDRTLPHAWTKHIAAEVTARVRHDLNVALSEIQAPAAHIDTDGVIVPENAPMPKNSGTGFGQFRVKEMMGELEVRAPQFYRYTRRDDGELSATQHGENRQRRWHYVASGMNEGQAADTFRRKHVATRISFMGSPDMVLPNGHSFDVAANRALYEEAKLLR